MKKRIFSLLLALAMLCSLLPQFTLPAQAEAPYSGSCGETLSWRFDPDSGLLSIEGSGAMENYENIRFVPWRGYRNAITSVSLPEGLTSISKLAFDGCSALTSVTIPGSVTDIGYYAFRSCSALTAIHVVENNPNYSSQDGVLFDKAKTELIQYPAGKADASYTIPNSVTSIDIYAFYGCSSLTSVTIGNSVTSIGDWAFSYCSSLTSVTIGNSVTSIGDYAFMNCSSLTSVTIPNSVTSIGKYAFYNCSSLTSVTIPNSVTSIGKYAFSHCSALTSVTIPNSVTSIGDAAFSSCSSLTSVTIPNSVTSISDWAFGKCSALTSVTIPNSVTSIGGAAFRDCSALTSVTISNSVTNIGGWAFSGCSALTSVTIPNSVTDIGSRAFGFADSGRVEGFTIYGYNKTAAQSYAEADGFKFVSLGDSCANDHDWDAGKLILKPEAEHSERVFTCSRCKAQSVEKLSNHPFTDVKDSKFYYVPVLWAYYHRPQITNGTSATLFSPNQPCTRGQVVSFLWRAYGEQQPKSGKNPFVDAKAGKYYYNAMLWAVENGVTAGTDATHFQPNDNCTRAQVVTFLWRAAGAPEPKIGKNPFVDVKAGKFYYKAVLWAVENGVTTGTDATHFSPNAGCTRGQVVTFLYRQQGQ